KDGLIRGDDRVADGDRSAVPVDAAPEAGSAVPDDRDVRQRAAHPELLDSAAVSAPDQTGRDAARGAALPGWARDRDGAVDDRRVGDRQVAIRADAAPGTARAAG